MDTNSTTREFRQVRSARPGRRWLAAIVTSIAAFCTLASNGAASAETVELKVSHWLPPSSAINQELIRWASELEAKSKGRLKLSIFPSSQMGPVTRQFDLARTGVADMAFFLHGAVPGRFALTELAQLPYAFNPEVGGITQKALSGADASAILTSLAPQLVSEYEGTRILYIIASPNIGLFFNKAVVHKPSDMKGMRIRHNGPIPAKMIDAWGATPASIAPVELADALEKGTLNGMTFNYEAVQSFQVGPSVKSVTEINAYAVTFALVINAKRYDALPPDLRALIDETTGVQAARRVGAKYDEAEAVGRRYLLDNKAEIFVPTVEQLQAFKTPVMPLVKETIDADQAKGLPAQKFYDALRTAVNAAKR